MDNIYNTFIRNILGNVSDRAKGYSRFVGEGEQTKGVERIETLVEA